jgi:hypothetical protein
MATKPTRHSAIQVISSPIMKNLRLAFLTSYSIIIVACMITPAWSQPETISSPRSTETTTVSTSSSGFPWGIISGVLHVVEIAGIGGLFWLMTKNKKSADSKAKTLAKEVKAANEKLKEQDLQIKRNEQDLVAINKRIDNFKSAPVTAAYMPNKAQPYPQFDESPVPTPQAAAPNIPKSNYKFLDDYNRNQESFTQKYFPTVVSEDADNINERRAGDSNDVILGENSRGNYWLVKEGSKIYLIPKPKMKIQEHNIRTVRELFDCATFDPDYQGFSVAEPALVSVYPAASGLKWRVDRKGELKFT